MINALLKIVGHSRALTEISKSLSTRNEAQRFNCIDVCFTTDSERDVAVPFFPRTNKF